MKPEEASQVIRDSYIPKMFTALEEALEVAIQALEKQVPKKVESFNNLNETRCPECRFVFGYSIELGEYDGEYYNYCVDCGQKLDWGNEE